MIQMKIKARTNSDPELDDRYLVSPKSMHGMQSFQHPLKALDTPSPTGVSDRATAMLASAVLQNLRIITRKISSMLQIEAKLGDQKINNVINVIYKPKQTYFENKNNNVKNNSQLLWITLKSLISPKPIKHVTKIMLKFMIKYKMDLMSILFQILNKLWKNGEFVLDEVSYFENQVVNPNNGLNNFKKLSLRELKNIIFDQQNKFPKQIIKKYF